MSLGKNRNIKWLQTQVLHSEQDMVAS